MSKTNYYVEITSDEQALSAGIDPALYRGKAAYLHIRYAPVDNPTDGQMSTTPDEYIGLYASHEATAPTAASSYTWARLNYATEEAARAAAETARASAETARASAEQGRATAEQGRATAEQGRASAEQGRVTAEMARQQAETQRQTAPRYLHIRYAAVDSPSDSQMTSAPATGSTYIGLTVTATATAPTTASSYTWARFRGFDGEGTGDMQAATYDPNGDGKVASADHADSAAGLDATLGVAAGGTGSTTAAGARANLGAAAAKHTHEADEVGAEPTGTVSKHNSAGDAHAALFDAKADKSAIKTGTLTAAGWTGSAAPYAQTLKIAGVPADQTVPVFVSISPSATAEQLEAWGGGKVLGTAHAEGTVTFGALGDKPDIDLPVMIVIAG